jgi:hypothetical protein
LSLPTPTASSYGSNQSASEGASVRPSLQSMASRGLWPTPLKQDARHSITAVSGPGMADKLAYAVVRWPTPNARDWKDSGPTQGNRQSPEIGTLVARFPTPTKDDARGVVSQGKPNQFQMLRRPAEHLGVSTGDKLNPAWVEWLMGWPVGWTDLAPLSSMESWQAQSEAGTWWREEPADVPRVASGVAKRVPRLEALGNGQVPQCVVLAWHILRGDR